MSRKRTLKIVGVIVLVLSIVFVLLNFIVETYLHKKIQKTEGIHAADIDCSIFGNVYILKQVAVDSSTNLPFTATCKLIKIKGFKRLKYLFSDELHFSEVIFEEADVVVHKKMLSDIDGLDIKKGSKNISIGDAVCRSSRLHYYEDGAEVIDAQALHLRLIDLAFNESDSISYEDIYAHSGPIRITPPESNHQMSIASVTYDPMRGSLSLGASRYYTTISKVNWYELVKEKQTRIDWKAEKIEIYKPDILSALNHGHMMAQRVLIDAMELDAFEDQRFTHCDTCKKTLPHLALRHLNKKVRLDSVLVVDGKINYSSLEIGQRTPASIWFDDVYGALYGMTNIPAEIKNQPRMLLDVQAKLFEETAMKLHMDFDLVSVDGRYTCKGQTQSFPLSQLNNYFERAKQVRISDGKCDGITFKIKANDALSHGLMNFPYRNMKVAFIKKDNTKRKFLSKLLNGLVVHKDNIQSDKYRQGIVYHTVDSSRSIFHSLSQSLQTGIQSSTLKSYVLPDELKRGKRDL